MGQREGTGQLVRDLWAIGRTSQFFLREVGTTDAFQQGGRSPDSGAHRRPLEAMGGDRLGSKNKTRANETT